MVFSSYCTVNPIKPLSTNDNDDNDDINSSTMMTIEDLQMEFTKTVAKIKQVLCEENENAISLVEELQRYTVVKFKKIPLFEDDIYKKVASIEDLWKILNRFWDIYDYDVLNFIMKRIRCKRAQRIYENFQSKIDPSTLEDAELVLASDETYSPGPTPRLRVKLKAKERCTNKVKNNVKNLLSKKFKVENYSLVYKCIHKGCVELTFISPSAAVISYLESCVVTGHDIVDFAMHNIKCIKTHQKEIQVNPSLIPNMVRN